MPKVAWIGGPVLLFDGVAVGVWFNWNLTPWRHGPEDEGIWFGRRSFVETKEDGSHFRRSVVALGLIALFRNELLS